MCLDSRSRWAVSSVCTNISTASHNDNFSAVLLRRTTSSQTGRSVVMACLCLCYVELGRIARFYVELCDFPTSVHGLFPWNQRNNRWVLRALLTIAQSNSLPRSLPTRKNCVMGLRWRICNWVEGDSWGGGDRGVKGLGSLQEAGEERVGDGIPKGTGIGRNRKYFAKTKAYIGGNH